MAEEKSRLHRAAELVSAVAVAGALAVVGGSAWWVFSAVVLGPIDERIAKVEADIATIEHRLDRMNDNAATTNNEVRGAIGDARTAITEIASRLDAVRVRLAERDRRPEPEPTRVVIRELPDRALAGIRRAPSLDVDADSVVPQAAEPSIHATPDGM